MSAKCVLYQCGREEEADLSALFGRHKQTNPIIAYHARKDSEWPPHHSYSTAY